MHSSAEDEIERMLGFVTSESDAGEITELLEQIMDKKDTREEFVKHILQWAKDLS